MNVDPSVTIDDIPILSIRDFFRRASDREWSWEWLGHTLKLSRDRSRRLIDELVKQGYVEASREKAYPWRCTEKGLALASARGTRPVGRGVAQAQLERFLKRVALANAHPDFVYRVRRVYLFGSYLTTDKERVGDLDLAVELEPTDTDHDQHWKRHDERVSAALRAGRHFSNYVEQIFWPKEEVMRFLRQRSRVIGLHSAENITGRGWPMKVIYEATPV